ncbi:NUDIX domain-containing protein [Sphingobacterium psychroaquaticum]|uniref:NUDIX domain-containing protein n=1 Tax=Sphingobacterium psychroaquaticum TaxID=561061 RepID=UPI001F0D2C5C|nr:NUDIX domain-containing protein [Sphingobacterium psychroaquaticum]
MNESQLILADFIPRKIQNPQTIGLQDIDIEKLFKLASTKGQPAVSYLYIATNIESVFKTIIQKVNIIKAAGGLVKNGEGNYLFIHRLGKWDLPKGKVEESEKMREAAVREVEEECGITVNYLGRKIETTYHTYIMRGKFMLKQTNWYEMGVNKVPKLVPQLEEDITEARWIGKDELNLVKENTYPMIAEIIKKIK